METKVEGPHVRWHHEVKNLADLPKKSHRMKIYSLFLYQISNGTHIDALDSVHLINWWQLRLARKLGHCCLSMIFVFLDILTRWALRSQIYVQGNVFRFQVPFRWQATVLFEGDHHIQITLPKEYTCYCMLLLGWKYELWYSE